MHKRCFLWGFGQESCFATYRLWATHKKQRDGSLSPGALFTAFLPGLFVLFTTLFGEATTLAYAQVESRVGGLFLTWYSGWMFTSHEYVTFCEYNNGKYSLFGFNPNKQTMFLTWE